MKRNLFLRLCLILTVMLSLYSCRNEDFANQDDHPKRNNADFFKHSKKGELNARSGIDYIDILQDYNRETNFLVTIPDQEGMPIWEKMLVLYHGEKTALYIPLSSGETSLSSLILISVDENNKVSALRNFTQDYLKSFVYDTKYPAEKRKFLMDTFLQMDFLTFGQQEFTNLPTDLYEGSGEYNRLNVADVKIETAQNRGFVYNTVCTTYHYCVHGHGLGNCDYGHCTCGGFLSCFVVTSCTTSATWIDDPMSSGFPTGGGSGGGGGGTPMEHTPDPCTQVNVFYRVAPGCNSGTDIPELLDDPCEKLKKMLETPTSLPIGAVSIKEALLDLAIVNPATASHEEGYNFKYNPTNGVMYAEKVTMWSPEDNSVIYTKTPNTFGGGHLHMDNLQGMFSHDDIAFLQKFIFWFTSPPLNGTNNADYPLPVHMLVANGEVYALVAEDINYVKAVISQIYNDEKKRDDFMKNLESDFGKLHGTVGGWNSNATTLERVFLKFVTKIDNDPKHHNLKVSLYKADNTLTHWNKLEISKNGNNYPITPKPCN